MVESAAITFGVKSLLTAQKIDPALIGRKTLLSVQNLQPWFAENLYSLFKIPSFDWFKTYSLSKLCLVENPISLPKMPTSIG
jgi:hypothetical protein